MPPIAGLVAARLSIRNASAAGIGSSTSWNTDEVAVLAGSGQFLEAHPPLVTSWTAPPQPMRFTDGSDSSDRYWIEVHGQDFGGTNLLPTVHVGRVECRRTVWVSDSVLRCEAPDLIGHEYHMSVVLAEQGSPGSPATLDLRKSLELGIPAAAGGFSPAVPEFFGARTWPFPASLLPPADEAAAAAEMLPVEAWRAKLAWGDLASAPDSGPWSLPPGMSVPSVSDPFQSVAQDHQDYVRRAIRPIGYERLLLDGRSFSPANLSDPFEAAAVGC